MSVLTEEVLKFLIWLSVDPIFMLKVCILSKEELSREVSRILTLVDLSEIEELDQLFL